MIKLLSKLWGKGKSASHQVVSDKPASHQEEVVDPNPYQAFLNHLVLREGIVSEVYLDSVGKLTAGVGHLLPVDTELEVGSPVSSEQVSEWLDQDAHTAWGAACTQCAILDIDDNDFLVALASVNFQLGTSWGKIHKKTWSYLAQHKFVEAAKEAEDSRWFKQTPVRVRDFQEGILQLVTKE